MPVHGIQTPSDAEHGLLDTAAGRGTMTRAKAEATHGKQPGGKTPKKGLPWFAWLLIVVAITGVVVLVRVYPMSQSSPDNLGKPRAAIVDQLSSLEPNEAFIAQVTSELEESGFAVDVYQGDEITVDFYRKLPTHGYKLIIFRVHSGLLGGGDFYIPRTVLFTNEEYSADRYPTEQVLGRLLMGAPGPGRPVMFGITASFVTGSMKGRFDNTVIVIMGCGGIYLTDLAEAFVEKGASAYLAWNLSVVLPYVDEATPYLIGELCSENATIEEAVNSTMQVKGSDPEYKAELQYYPSGTGNRTLEELVQTGFDAGDDTRA
jgi:hypothetical protein